MSTDYAEMERIFISALEEDTGRNLAAWMAAIEASGKSDRNAIIDWLRHQGFQFAKASWLERIHHNGGRLIYADAPANAPHRMASITPRAGESLSDEPPSLGRLSPQPIHLSPQQDSQREIQPLLVNAKGLRPLADLILSEVARVVPGVKFSAEGSLIMMTAVRPFAALSTGAKMLRFYANFGREGAGRSKVAEPINKAKPPFPDMLLIDDARTVDEEFRRLVRLAGPR